MTGDTISRLLGRRIWSLGRIDDLAGETLTTLTKISQAFEARQVQLSTGTVAWGQYLDGNHFSHSQWGFYGTSAALQTLALRARSGGNTPSGDSLIASALVLPERRTVTDAIFDEKRAKNDFENVVKLAFIADGLTLDYQDNVPDALTPPLVDDMIGMAVANERWTSRLPNDPDYSSKDQDFPTALIVSVLRRFERFRARNVWDRSRHWLANRVLQDGAFREQRTLLALTGLALLPHPDDPHDSPARVIEALTRCEDELLAWVSGQGRTIVLNRPVFNGFSIGSRNDYVFLHPELLTGLFLLRRGSPMAGRRFVLDVVEALWMNVDQRDGFMGQDGMVTSVDQLWASRLIREFQHMRRERGADQLLPRFDSYVVPHGWKARLAWIAALLVLALFVSVLAGWAGVATFVVGVILLGVDWIKNRR